MNTKHSRPTRHERSDALARAHHCCEWPGCGAKQHQWGAHDKRGHWHAEDSIHVMNSSDGEAAFGGFPEMHYVRLSVTKTIDAPNFDVVSCMVLCALHRNRLTLARRVKKARITRAATIQRKRDEATRARGQLPLLDA